MPASKKNIARKPITAKIFEVYTRNSFCVMANAAGIESTAKIKSVVSIKTITRNNGVNISLPLARAQ